MHAVAKDRAAPFSKKHRRYWLTITGGMILIGALNVAIGYCAYPGDKTVYRHTEQIIPVLPVLHDAAPAAPDATSAPDASEL
jgi:hypothetical protein